MDEVDSEEENCEEEDEECPSGDDVYGGFVQPVLNGAADCFVVIDVVVLLVSMEYNGDK